LVTRCYARCYVWLFRFTLFTDLPLFGCCVTLFTLRLIYVYVVTRYVRSVYVVTLLLGCWFRCWFSCYRCCWAPIYVVRCYVTLRWTVVTHVAPLRCYVGRLRLQLLLIVVVDLLLRCCYVVVVGYVCCCCWSVITVALLDVYVYVTVTGYVVVTFVCWVPGRYVTRCVHVWFVYVTLFPVYTFIWFVYGYRFVWTFTVVTVTLLHVATFTTFGYTRYVVATRSHVCWLLRYGLLRYVYVCHVGCYVTFPVYRGCSHVGYVWLFTLFVGWLRVGYDFTVYVPVYVPVRLLRYVHVRYVPVPHGYVGYTGYVTLDLDLDTHGLHTFTPRSGYVTVTVIRLPHVYVGSRLFTFIYVWVVTLDVVTLHTGYHVAVTFGYVTVTLRLRLDYRLHVCWIYGYTFTFTFDFVTFVTVGFTLIFVCGWLRWFTVLHVLFTVGYPHTFTTVTRTFTRLRCRLFYTTVYHVPHTTRLRLPVTTPVTFGWLDVPTRGVHVLRTLVRTFPVISHGWFYVPLRTLFTLRYRWIRLRWLRLRFVGYLLRFTRLRCCSHVTVGWLIWLTFVGPTLLGGYVTVTLRCYVYGCSGYRLPHTHLHIFARTGCSRLFTTVSHGYTRLRWTTVVDLVVVGWRLLLRCWFRSRSRTLRLLLRYGRCYGCCCWFPLLVTFDSRLRCVYTLHVAFRIYVDVGCLRYDFVTHHGYVVGCCDLHVAIWLGGYTFWLRSHLRCWTLRLRAPVPRFTRLHGWFRWVGYGYTHVYDPVYTFTTRYVYVCRFDLHTGLRYRLRWLLRYGLVGWTTFAFVYITLPVCAGYTFGCWTTRLVGRLRWLRLPRLRFPRLPRSGLHTRSHGWLVLVTFVTVYARWFIRSVRFIYGLRSPDGLRTHVYIYVTRLRISHTLVTVTFGWICCSRLRLILRLPRFTVCYVVQLRLRLRYVTHSVTFTRLRLVVAVCHGLRYTPRLHVAGLDFTLRLPHVYVPRWLYTHVYLRSGYVYGCSRRSTVRYVWLDYPTFCGYTFRLRCYGYGRWFVPTPLRLFPVWTFTFTLLRFPTLRSFYTFTRLRSYGYSWLITVTRTRLHGWFWRLLRLRFTGCTVYVWFWLRLVVTRLRWFTFCYGDSRLRLRWLHTFTFWLHVTHAIFTPLLHCVYGYTRLHHVYARSRLRWLLRLLRSLHTVPTLPRCYHGYVTVIYTFVGSFGGYGCDLPVARLRLRCYVYGRFRFTRSGHIYVYFTLPDVLYPRLPHVYVVGWLHFTFGTFYFGLIWTLVTFTLRSRLVDLWFTLRCTFGYTVQLPFTVTVTLRLVGYTVTRIHGYHVYVRLHVGYYVPVYHVTRLRLYVGHTLRLHTLLPAHTFTHTHTLVGLVTGWFVPHVHVYFTHVTHGCPLHTFTVRFCLLRLFPTHAFGLVPGSFAFTRSVTFVPVVVTIHVLTFVTVGRWVATTLDLHAVTFPHTVTHVTHLHSHGWLRSRTLRLRLHTYVYGLHTFTRTLVTLRTVGWLVTFWLHTDVYTTFTILRRLRFVWLLDGLRSRCCGLFTVGYAGYTTFGWLHGYTGWFRLGWFTFVVGWLPHFTLRLRYTRLHYRLRCYTRLLRLHVYHVWFHVCHTVGYVTHVRLRWLIYGYVTLVTFTFAVGCGWFTLLRDTRFTRGYAFGCWRLFTFTIHTRFGYVTTFWVPVYVAVRLLRLRFTVTLLRCCCRLHGWLRFTKVCWLRLLHTHVPTRLVTLVTFSSRLPHPLITRFTFYCGLHVWLLHLRYVVWLFVAVTAARCPVYTYGGLPLRSHLHTTDVYGCAGFRIPGCWLRITLRLICGCLILLRLLVAGLRLRYVYGCSFGYVTHHVLRLVHIGLHV